MINVQQIKTRYQRLCRLVSSRRVKDALDVLNGLVGESGFSDFFIQQEHLEHTYEQMLNYMLEGVQDPERDKVYMKLLTSILELADRVGDLLMEKHSGWHTYILKQEVDRQQELTGKSVIETMDDLSFKRELDEMIDERQVSPEATDERRRKLSMEIFRHLWLSNRYNEAENSLSSAILTCKDFLWHEKALYISGILLSGLRYWDEEKVHRLIDFAGEEEQEVSARAIVALVILLYRYDDRIEFYPNIVHRLKLLKDDLKLEQSFEKIALQLIRTRDTLEIGRKLQEDLMPEMAKLKPKLEDKLKMDDIRDEMLEEGRNPDWESMFSESDDLFRKVDEFMKLQMEGADVYMTTFAHLKQFPFFNELTNWLVPFHKENPDLSDIYSSRSEVFDPDIFVDGLKNTPFLCNSDKYSFIFNIRHLPDDQKKMLSTAFLMEIEGLQEMISDEKVTSGDFTKRTVFIQYIQDLYRFFKISPFKNEFEDVFGGKLDLYRSYFFREIIEDNSITRNIAEYLFEKDHFEEALDIFKMMLEQQPDDRELLEKAGYCYQKDGNYQKAIRYYSRIGLSGEQNKWTLKNLGICYREINDYKTALKVYENASALQPDDQTTKSLIGYCNLKLGNYQTALEHYFKIEYLNPGNQHILRPIAWCYFALGELEKSKKYFQQVFELKPGYYDYINYGHVQWALGNKREAIELYIQSLRDLNFEMEDFLKTMVDDQSMLIRNGINKKDIPLMLDYLHYRLMK
ncbi:MAG: tetratricopeptide repeat protein [Bacteroidales bacterium]|nr:tetratricopeptide repeat protein [Bacteroidales bacterium]